MYVLSWKSFMSGSMIYLLQVTTNWRIVFIFYMVLLYFLFGLPFLFYFFTWLFIETSFLLFLIMCECVVQARTYGYRCFKRPKQSEVMGSCESPNMTARNWTQISRKAVLTLNHWSVSPALSFIFYLAYFLLIDEDLIAVPSQTLLLFKPFIQTEGTPNSICHK